MESGQPLPSDELMLQQDKNPAYQVLQRHKLLVWKYKIASADQIDGVPANSSMWKNTCYRAGLFVALVVPYIIDKQTTRHFQVKEGHIRTGQDKGGKYYFFLPGVHRLFDPFMSIDEDDLPITRGCIQHGNRSIVTVQQGFIGLCFDRGQPVLLPPGMHQWKSDTMMFERTIDLAQSVISLGPYTLVTVDEGYAAITQDNGKQIILKGGEMHMLTHRNWKFEKFLTQKIQTNDLKAIRTTSSDNVILQVTANVSWRITDVDLTARMSAETMGKGSDDLEKIKADVLQQCTASLSAFVGGLTYADKIGVSAAAAGASKGGASAGQAGLYDHGRLSSAVAHANDVCKRYGVEIIGINIISAYPQDQALSQALAAGAVTQAQSEQQEAAAQGEMKALMVRTKGQADAIRMTAEAQSDAAKKLEQSQVAVELARIQKAGEAISDKHAFFFGANNAQQISGLLANPAVVKR